MVGFERLKDEYTGCPNFEFIFQEIMDGTCHVHLDFLIRDGYLVWILDYAFLALHLKILLFGSCMLVASLVILDVIRL